MPLIKLNLLYGCVAVSMGLNSSLVWAAKVDIETQPIQQLIPIKVEATRTNTTYMETPAFNFPY